MSHDIVIRVPANESLQPPPTVVRRCAICARVSVSSNAAGLSSLRAQVEGAYPPLALAQVPQAQAIVLLGGGMRPAERAGQMPNMRSAADRVWLAARLYKAGKAPQVLVSGGGDRAVYATSEAQAMRELLLDMGVPAADALDGSARAMKELVGRWVGR